MKWLSLMLLVGVPALGHPLLQNGMEVRVEPGTVRVALQVSLREILVTQSVARENDGGFDAEVGRRAADQHGAYLLRHLKILADGNPLAGRVARWVEPVQFTSAEKSFYQYELAYPLGNARPMGIKLEQEMLREFPYAPGLAWDVSYVVRHNGQPVGLLRVNQPVTLATGWAAPPVVVSRWRMAGDYLRHGVMHILTGYDHLLFVTALVLATLRLWEMVKVIAAFTLAHTLTLALAVFDVVRLPARVVEPVIALSIVFVALENVLWPHRARSRARLAVAFGFGLVHGLGFAGGLRDAMASLPAAGIGLALVAFSLGVELGHQLVVLPLFGLLGAGRRRWPEAARGPVLRYGSALISAGGAFYLFVAIRQLGGIQ